MDIGKNVKRITYRIFQARNPRLSCRAFSYERIAKEAKCKEVFALKQEDIRLQNLAIHEIKYYE